MKNFAKFLLAASLVWGVFSCKTKMETVVVELPMLRPSSLYLPDSVRRHIPLVDAQREELAEFYLSKARDTLAHNLPKAIFYTKRAISLDPTLDSYQYLADLLEKEGNYAELKKLYALLFHEPANATAIQPDNRFIFGKPDKEIFYNFMVAEILTNDFIYGQSLYLADHLNYPLADFKSQVLADKRLQLDRGSRAFKNLMLYFMTEEEIKAYTGSETNFRNFIASISDTVRTFELDEKAAQTFDYANMEYQEEMDISQFYVHYLEEKQKNPDGWYTFDIKHLVRLEEGLHAVIYAIDTSETAAPADMRHIYHRLVTYKNNGQIISSQVVANQSGEDLSLLQFNKNKFVVADYKRTWKNPYVKSAFDNILVKTEKMGERSFVITPRGEIVQEAVLAAAAPDSAQTKTAPAN
jgi:hypothetical protein